MTGLIGQILHRVIIVTFLFDFVQAIRKQQAGKVAWPLAIILIANLIFASIQFGILNMPLASVDLLMVWGSMIWMMQAIWKHDRWIAVAPMPYLCVWR